MTDTNSCSSSKPSWFLPHELC